MHAAGKFASRRLCLVRNSRYQHERAHILNKSFSFSTHPPPPPPLFHISYTHIGQRAEGQQNGVRMRVIRGNAPLHLDCNEGECSTVQRTIFSLPANNCVCDPRNLTSIVYARRSFQSR